MGKLLTNVVKHLYVVRVNVNGKYRNVKVEAESDEVARHKAEAEQKREYGDGVSLRTLYCYRVDDDDDCAG